MSAYLANRDSFALWQTIPVRAADMDARRHVNNATYLIYFEVARRAFFEAHTAFAEFETRGQNPVLVTQTCNYRNPLRYPATIDIGLALREVKTRSFTFDYAVFPCDAEDVVADGHTTHAWYDEGTDSAVALPEEILVCLTKLERT